MKCPRPTLLSLLFILLAGVARAQTPDSPPAQQGQPQGTSPGDRPGQRHTGTMPGQGTIGIISAISGDSLTISRPDGPAILVKITDKTDFRKDRQPAKLSDFKIGDFVMVRGQENPDHSITAQVLGSRSGRAGPAGPGGGAWFGEQGKDFIAGEVKSIEAPKLTVLRTDSVTQTLELTEETALRKGRESITMADIRPGDHVVLRGGLQNNVFVTKTLILLSPEQWERMQQFARGTGNSGGNAQSGSPGNGNPPNR